MKNMTSKLNDAPTNISIDILQNNFCPNVDEAYKDKFIKIPCELLELLQYDNKLILTLLSLFKHKTIYNTITISLKDIIIENGYIPTKGKNKNIEQFKNSLFNLMKLDIIEFFSDTLKQIVELQKNYEKTNNTHKSNNTLSIKSEFSKLFDTITLNTMLALRFNETEINTLTTNNFVILEYNITNTFKQICAYNKNIKMSNLINVYLILKKHIETNKAFSKDEWNISIDYLSKFLKMSTKTICNTIKSLENNRILFVKRKNGKNYYSLIKSYK